MWVARNRSGRLDLHYKFPIKQTNIWDSDGVVVTLPLDDGMPEVQWEDDQPRKVKLVLEED